MSILKDELLKEVEVINHESGLDFNMDDICQESAIVAKGLTDALVVLDVISKDENISYETALAYALPLYGFDRDALIKDVEEQEALITESADDDAKTAAGVVGVFNAIIEIIKKAFRLFYVMFKKVQQKIILFLNQTKPYIEKLKTKIDTKDFGTSKALTESDREAIAGFVGVYGMFTQKIDESTIPAIITSFKNLDAMVVSLSGYNKLIGAVKNDLLSTGEDKKDNVIGEIKGLFFASMPKFYKKIGDTVLSNQSSNLLNYKPNVDPKTFDNISVIGTDGKKLLVVANMGLILVSNNANIIVPAMAKNISENFKIDDTKTKMLVAAIEKVDIKKISDEIRKGFETIEGTTNTFFKEVTNKNSTSGDQAFASQIVKAILSHNVSILNTAAFEYINMNAKLMINTLKFVNLMVDKCENKASAK